MPSDACSTKTCTPAVTRRQFLGTGAAAGLGALTTTGSASPSQEATSALGYGGHPESHPETREFWLPLLREG